MHEQNREGIAVESERSENAILTQLYSKATDINHSESEALRHALSLKVNKHDKI